MVVTMPLHKLVFQKCLDFSKPWKSRQNRYKTVSLNLKFEHKVWSQNIMSTFRSILNLDVNWLNGKVTLLTMIFTKKHFQIFLRFGDRDERV